MARKLVKKQVGGMIAMPSSTYSDGPSKKEARKEKINKVKEKVKEAVSNVKSKIAGDKKPQTKTSSSPMFKKGGSIKSKKK